MIGGLIQEEGGRLKADERVYHNEGGVTRSA